MVRVGIDLGPGQAATLAVGYRLQSTGGGGDGLAYRLTADPQVLLDPPVLRVEVTGPPGMVPAPADGWTVEDGASVLVRRLDAVTTATLDLHG